MQSQVEYIIILTMNLLQRQPFSHTSHEMLSVDTKTDKITFPRPMMSIEIQKKKILTIKQGMSMA
jgi:hypothetical protein